MKATFFAKPLEYNLTIDGEAWTQGSKITGKLTLTNHGSEALENKNIGCHLCLCSSKKFKAQDPKSITVIESLMLAPNQSELSFEFQLANDCPITDITGSLYILCGDMTKPFEGGFLELKITPMAPIMYFVQAFELFYRFQIKAFKNKKGFLEAALNAPDAKEWTRIQKMSMQLRMNEKDLEVKFSIAIKSLSFEAGPSKTKDEKKEITKVLTPKQYELYGSANQDEIKKVLEEVISEIKLKPLC